MRVTALILASASCGHAATVKLDSLAELPLLSPATGPDIALQQRLSFDRLSATEVDPSIDAPDSGDITTLDVLLILSRTSTRLAAMSNGLRVISLTWDGDRLDETRRPEVPAHVSSRRMLVDLQLAWWPSDVIRLALPSGLQLTDVGLHRTLRRGDTVVVDIEYPSGDRYHGRTVFRQLEVGYAIVIDSRPVEGGTAP